MNVCNVECCVEMVAITLKITKNIVVHALYIIKKSNIYFILIVSASLSILIEIEKFFHAFFLIFSLKDEESFYPLLLLKYKGFGMPNKFLYLCARANIVN